jgi:hypothetical protein
MPQAMRADLEIGIGDELLGAFRMGLKPFAEAKNVAFTPWARSRSTMRPS